MSITIKEIEHLAKLSKLSLTDEEKERLTGEMAGVLEFAKTLDELDSSDILPTMHPGAASNVFREDIVKESYDRREILKNAPNADETSFVVPKTVE